MKKLVSKLILLSLLVVLMAPATVKAINANTNPYSESLPSSGAMPAPATPATGNQSAVPDTFKVNDYLKTDNQKSYVPSSADASSADPAQSNGVVVILLKTIDLFVKIIGSIALIVFILGAILTITSEGKEDRLEKGKTAMVYALIGLAITFFAFIIVAFVQSVLF